MRKLTIREPIWKYKAIGIADWKVDDDFQIKIAYKNKYGEKLFPHTYLITEEEIKKCPLRYLGGLFVYLVKITKLKIRSNNGKKRKT